jgi:hypothetical protein
MQPAREQDTGTPDIAPGQIPLTVQEQGIVNRRNREVANLLRNQINRRRDFPATPSTSADITGDLRDTVLTDAPAPAPRRTDKEMSKPVLFYGKPSQIDDVLTHVTVKFLADNITDHGPRCGYLASLYRGPALTWLSQYLRTHQLDDYDEFVEQTKQAFALTDEALQGQLNRQLTQLRQKGSVQNYALNFRQLQLQLNLPAATAIACFKAGLKPHIQRALVTDNSSTTLEDHIGEATRIDSEFYNISGARTPGRFNANRSKSGRDKQGRFTPRVKSEH